MMKILLVDDHALFREGMKLLLGRLDPELALIEAGSAEAALLLVETHGEFDLILLDLNLPGMSGCDGVRMMRRCYPSSPLAVLSGVESGETVRDCLASGAQAYVPKSVSSDVMLLALGEVLAGRTYHPALNGTAGPSSPKAWRSPWKLTLRQIDVLAQVSQGLSNKEIARKLEMSENTVRTHLAAIFSELGVRSRTEVAALAHRHGIV